MKKAVSHYQRKAITAKETADRSPRFQGGFTLLEIMVALSIIAIVLVSVYRMHAQTISMNNETRFYATAPMLAQFKMAEIESESLEDMGDDSGDFGDKFPDYRWNVVVDDVESSALENMAKHLKKIDLIISLNNDEFSYSLRSYKYLKN
ncbi:MAG: prepilin-type N-terminal cleavage/methylation domain-containing protein [Deltaproteobacteria bacterium]|jgi:general secretion pathway protein I|nr:prepilin-type N-terminal cleavage/methylation domain-containing protein [Deltaproteobacteria bacterium]